MTLPQSLTREEAQRQIAELQRHIDSLPKNNHPANIEHGMLFKHNMCGLCIAVCKEITGSEYDIMFLDGKAWSIGFAFNGSENDFEYLGYAKDLLVLKTDKPDVVVTDEMAMKARSLLRNSDGDVKQSLKHVLTLALNGKL